MGFFRKKYEKAKYAVKDELRHRSELRKAEKESYREASLKQAKEFGKKKAAYESGEKLKKLKQKPKSFEFTGFAGPTQKNPTASLGIGDALLGKQKKKKGGGRGGFGDMGLF